MFFVNLPEEVKHFYELALLRDLITYSAGLFLPLYIYTSTGSLLYTVLHGLIAYALARAVFFKISLRAVEKYGIEKAMLGSILLSVLTYTTVFFCEMDLPVIIFVSFLVGASINLYWISYHSSFGLYGKEGERVEECAGYELISRVISILYPFVSGAVIYVLGFKAFFILVNALVISILFFISKSFRKKHRVRYDFRKVVRNKYSPFFFIEGLFFSMFLLVPLYLYIYLGQNALSFGGVKSLVTLVSSIALFVVARKVDQERKYSLGVMFYILAALAYLVMGLSRDVVLIIFGNLLLYTSFVFSMGVYGFIYAKSQKGDKEVIAARVFYNSLGKTASFILLLAFAMTGDLFFQGFLAGTMFSFLCAYIYTRLEKQI